jgi:hypothetical protein
MSKPADGSPQILTNRKVGLILWLSERPSQASECLA